MTNIRRHFRPGDVCFLTHVVEKRMPILVENIDLLRGAVRSIKECSPFIMKAWVILPDHFQMLIDRGDQDLPGLVKRIKLSFSTNYRKRAGWHSGRVWQHRYWDHIIRNSKDMKRHIDYIHYNPVKHGLVDDPFVYENSSIHEFMKRGYYERDWGVAETVNIEGEFGE